MVQALIISNTYTMLDYWKKSHFFLIRMSLLLKITQKTLLYLSFCKTYYLIIIQIVISKLILCIYAI